MESDNEYSDVDEVEGHESNKVEVIHCSQIVQSNPSLKEGRINCMLTSLGRQKGKQKTICTVLPDTGATRTIVPLRLAKAANL